MANPATYRPAAGTIPTEPGVYTFRDPEDRVLYVGKAKNLRARLSNYFQTPEHLHPRTRQMLFAASQVRWTVVASEDEALNLEYTWIKRFNPRYNVVFRDDKSYPMLAVSQRERIPRAWVYRGPRRKGVRYFGPFPKVWAVRESLESLTQVFPVRTCSKGVYHRHELLGRPCLLGYIDKCSAPCIGRISEEDHRKLITGLCSVFAGNSRDIIKSLTADMEAAATELNFEKAAHLRDDIEAIKAVSEKQAIVLPEDTDTDLIGVSADELEAAVQIFTVRRGRIHGQRAWVVERSGDSEDSIGALIREFLLQYYSDEVERAQETVEETTAVEGSRVLDDVRQPVPREVLVMDEPEDITQIGEYLSGLRGAHVDIRVPQRGDKRALMDTVIRNAAESLHQHKLRRTGDLTARSAAIEAIQENLGMAEPPLRIECTDISHLQGTDVVASLVVFEDGAPKKSDYRRYKIKEAAGEGHSDDVASIKEVVRRRFLRYKKGSTEVPDDGAVADSIAAEESKLAPSEVAEVDTNADLADPSAAKRFAYSPQLLVVDGGAPQVNAAQEVLDELGITDVTLCGIAKRLEEVWLPHEEFPVILPRRSEGLYLFQNIRDEAHRVAITYQRSRRTGRLRQSELDNIAGLGEKRKADLLKTFGSVAQIKKASIDDLTTANGIGPALAALVYEGLHGKSDQDSDGTNSVSEDSTPKNRNQNK